MHPFANGLIRHELLVLLLFDEMFASTNILTGKSLLPFGLSSSVLLKNRRPPVVEFPVALAVALLVVLVQLLVELLVQLLVELLPVELPPVELPPVELPPVELPPVELPPVELLVPLVPFVDELFLQEGELATCVLSC